MMIKIYIWEKKMENLLKRRKGTKRAEKGGILKKNVEVEEGRHASLFLQGNGWSSN